MKILRFSIGENEKIIKYELYLHVLLENDY